MLLFSRLPLTHYVLKAPSTRCAFSVRTYRAPDNPFLQAYSITLCDGREVIARVARRFMPRLKIESEVATMDYIRSYTSIPVPTVYFYDSNPFNRLGGEYMIMSKVCLT